MVSPSSMPRLRRRGWSVDRLGGRLGRRLHSRQHIPSTLEHRRRIAATSRRFFAREHMDVLEWSIFDVRTSFAGQYDVLSTDSRRLERKLSLLSLGAVVQADTLPLVRQSSARDRCGSAQRDPHSLRARIRHLKPIEGSSPSWTTPPPRTDASRKRNMKREFCSKSKSGPAERSRAAADVTRRSDSARRHRGVL